MLVRVVIELAVFLRCEIADAGGGDTGVSLEVEFLDIQAKGLVNLRLGGGGGIAAVGAAGGAIDPEPLVVSAAALLFAVESVAGGDQGIAGRELAILLSESFLEGCFAGTGGGASGSSTLAS